MCAHREDMKSLYALTMTFLFAAGTLVGCADDSIESASEDRLTENPAPGGSCAGACGAQSADGCWCDAECASYGDCCSDKAPVCDGADCTNGEIVVTKSFEASTDDKECVVETDHCVTNDFGACPLLSPLPPDYCPEGTIVQGTASFMPSSDGMECEMPSVHCVTNDYGACPQFSPLPPDYCADGDVVQGATTFIPSTDGMECEIPSVHCVTTDANSCEPEDDCAGGQTQVEQVFADAGNGLSCAEEVAHCVTDDFGACPLYSPLPPDYCPDGQIMAGPAKYMASSDGMECELPSAHCVTTDYDACPLWQPLPPDYCEGGQVMQGANSFMPSSDGMECVVPSVHCVVEDLCD